MLKVIAMVFISFHLSACTSLVVGTATSATVGVVKAPFKIGGAIIKAGTPERKKDRR